MENTELTLNPVFFILVESAWMVIQKDPVLSLCFHNLTKRMQPNKAIIRIERKLIKPDILCIEE